MKNLNKSVTTNQTILIILFMLFSATAFGQVRNGQCSVAASNLTEVASNWEIVDFKLDPLTKWTTPGRIHRTNAVYNIAKKDSNDYFLFIDGFSVDPDPIVAAETFLRQEDVFFNEDDMTINFIAMSRSNCQSIVEVWLNNVFQDKVVVRNSNDWEEFQLQLSNTANTKNTIEFRLVSYGAFIDFGIDDIFIGCFSGEIINGDYAVGSNASNEVASSWGFVDFGPDQAAKWTTPGKMHRTNQVYNISHIDTNDYFVFVDGFHLDLDPIKGPETFLKQEVPITGNPKLRFSAQARTNCVATVQVWVDSIYQGSVQIANDTKWLDFEVDITNSASSSLHLLELRAASYGAYTDFAIDNLQLSCNDETASNIELENILKNLVLIYPNPCIELLNLDVSVDIIGTKYLLYDLQGHIVLEGIIDSTLTNIDVNGLNGLFLLKLEAFPENYYKILVQ
jgi:hypothetical protein